VSASVGHLHASDFYQYVPDSRSHHSLVCALTFVRTNTHMQVKDQRATIVEARTSTSVVRWKEVEACKLLLVVVADNDHSTETCVNR
jgi:hypothetical protein